MDGTKNPTEGGSVRLKNLDLGTKYDIQIFGVNKAGRGEAADTTFEISYNKASGGQVTDVLNYNGTGQKWRIHQFDADGTFEVQAAVLPFRVLCVAGGGGASSSAQSFAGGGGGAGGMLSLDSASLIERSYSAVIGGGGKGGSAGHDAYGTDSSFTENLTKTVVLSTKGGGCGGGCGGSRSGGSGGSGGGGSWGANGGGNGGSGIDGQGHNGCRDYSGYVWGSGGGGGAGSAGNHTNGGSGRSNDITGTEVYYAPGGNGQSGNPGQGWGSPGSGGKYGNGSGHAGVVIVAYQIG